MTRWLTISGRAGIREPAWRRTIRNESPGLRAGAFSYPWSEADGRGGPGAILPNAAIPVPERWDLQRPRNGRAIN